MGKHRFARRLPFLAFLLCLVLAFGTVAFAAQLSDVDNHWAAGEIAKAIEKGYVKGYLDGTFKPNQAVTRAEFVTMVNGAFAVVEGGNTLHFSDVKEGDWFYKNVAAAVAAEYIKGYPDGTFRPNQGITRQEAAVVLYGLVGSGDKADLTFRDAGQIGSWARDAVAGLVAGKVIAGYPDNTFGPTRSINRAEAVVMINKAVSLKMGQPVVTPGEPANLKLTPDKQQKYLEETVTLTATLTDKDGHAVPGKSVAFQVQRGGKIVLDKAVATDNDGKAEFSYKGPAEPATDTIAAKFGDLSATATVEWERKPAGGGGGGGGITTITVTSTSNPFSAASTYNHNYVFNSGAENGTYGPASGTATITGDVTVNVPGITLKNLVIKGDLVAGAGIGEGDLTLDNVTVEGKSDFNGGGSDSIILNGNTKLMGTVTINKAGLRLLVQGSAKVTGTVMLYQPATLEASSDSAFAGAVKVNISQASGEITVNIKAPINNVVVLAAPANTKITVAGDKMIGNIEVQATGVTIENYGTINTVQAGEGTVINGNLPEKVEGGSEAKLEATDRIGVHEGKVYEEYQLKVGDNVIDLSSSNVEKISVVSPDNTTANLEPNADTTLWFNVQKPAGAYQYTVVDKNRKVYTATLSWTEPMEVTATATGKEGDNNGNHYVEYTLGNLDLSSFDAMYQIKPLTEGQTVPDIFELEANSDQNLWFKTTDQVEGIHTFLVKKDGKWYISTINAYSTYKLTQTGLDEKHYTSELVDVIGKDQNAINLAVEQAIDGLTPIQVRLATDVKGAAGYDAVRIAPVNAGNNIQLWAKDTAGNWYDINKSGWGPEIGFPLSAEYDVTTAVYLISDQAGSYDLTVKLVDVKNNNSVIAQVYGTAVVVGPTITAPGSLTVFAGEERSFTVSASNPADGKNYDSVLFQFTVPDASKDDINLQYKDNESWISVPLSSSDSNVTGCFGPESGFPMTAPYTASTDFKVTLNKAGTYDVNIKLVDRTKNQTITSTMMPAAVLGWGESVQELENATRPSVLLDGSNTYMWYVSGNTILRSTYDNSGWSVGEQVYSVANSVYTPWDTTELGDSPYVIKDGDNYYMFISSSDGSEIDLYSSSDGLYWKDKKGVLQKGYSTDWDGGKIDNPMVLKDDNGYKLYYQGYQVTDNASNRIYQIGLATSTSIDGPYNRIGTNPIITPSSTVSDWDSYRVFQPWVVKDGDTYYMWYAGNSSAYNGGPDAIGFAYSTDGINWVKGTANPVVGTTGNTTEGRPSVINDGGDWYMWLINGSDIYSSTVPKDY